jgi:hypothetical protein
MSELIVLIRIALHLLSGYLLAAGVPPEVVHIITTNPEIVNGIAAFLAALPSLISLAWWRVAKWRGWST